MILTVTVNPAIDKNYMIPGFAITGIHRVQAMSAVAAGKGLNVSRVLRTLGVPTLATGFAGGFTGKQIEASLRQQEVGYDFVRVRAESRSNILIVDDNGGTHTEVKEPGPRIPGEAWKRLRKKIIRLAPTCDWVVFSGSPPPDTPSRVYFQWIQDVKELGVKVALDTRGPWLKEGIKAKPDLVKPNWEEFQELVGPCYSRVQAMNKARTLMDEGLGAVVVSMGAKGALAVHNKHTYSVQNLPPIEVISAVGSGDSLVAGILAKQLEGKDFATALQFGLAVACSNTAHFGAGIFDPEQVAVLTDMITVEEIN